MAWSETRLNFLWCCWVQQQSKGGGRRATVILPLIWFGWGTKRSWRDMGCCFCITSSTWHSYYTVAKNQMCLSLACLWRPALPFHMEPSRQFISSRTYHSFPDVVGWVVSYSQTTIEYFSLLFICCKGSHVLHNQNIHKYVDIRHLGGWEGGWDGDCHVSAIRICLNLRRLGFCSEMTSVVLVYMMQAGYMVLISIWVLMNLPVEYDLR